MDEPLWTLRELAAEVAAQLARNYEATDNGQVRPIPDERGIRYYTTLGLIDRPAAMRGRTALYSRRHLAQVVAIKRLQAVGRSLADIQRLLPTVDDATLSRIAGVVLPGATRARGRAAFWREAPGADAAAVAAPAAVADPVAVAAADPVTVAAPAGGFAPVWQLPLAPGVSIAIAAARPPTDADADALRRAAAPLIAELARRALVTNAPSNATPDPDQETAP